MCKLYTLFFVFFLFISNRTHTNSLKEGKSLTNISYIYSSYYVKNVIYIDEVLTQFFFYQYFNRTCKSRFYSTIVLWKGELESLFNFPYFRIVQIKKKKKSKFIKSINFKIVTFGSRVIRYLFVGIHT